MKLAEEIIDGLGSEDVPLTQSLLKTKILLHKIGLPKLADWVNNELNGYAEDVELPAYRILPAQVVGNIANAVAVYQAHPIPIGHLTEKQRSELEESRMNQSLAVLEDLVKGKGGQLQASLRMELNSILGKSLASGFVIQRAWCEISPSAVKGILIQVRSRLLDFLLSLDGVLPKDEVDETELRRRAASANATAMFNNAMFGNNANVTVVVGTSNEVRIVNGVTVGDIESLLVELRKSRIPESDLERLRTAIALDAKEVDHQNKKLGPAVRTWFDSMLTKVSDASWQIELNIAAGILTTKLQSFYGWLT